MSDMKHKEFYRLNHCQYMGVFYPLENVESGNSEFQVEIHTTFGLRKTLVVSAQASDSIVQEKTEFPRLSGFVALELEVPFDWQNLSGHQRDEQLTDDSDVSVYTGWHQFAERQSLQILERNRDRYLMKILWQFEDAEQPVTAFGWFSFAGITLHSDDKVFGAKRRKLNSQYEDKVPTEMIESLDADIREAAWGVLSKISPLARTQYEEPTVDGGNVCRFKLKLPK